MRIRNLGESRPRLGNAYVNRGGERVVFTRSTFPL